MNYALPLTPRQSAAAACLLDSLTGEQAAAAQGISVKAAHRRVEHLRLKMNAPSTLRLAKRLRLMAANDPGRTL